MKCSRVLFFVIFSALVLSCDSDSTSNEQSEDAMEDLMDQDAADDEPDGEDTNEETVTIGIVNAFPNLSFSQPLDLQVANDGSNKIYVAEKRGEIKVFLNDSSTVDATTFLDLGNIATSSEQGLLGFAFHPDFASNGYFYVHYTPTSTVAFVSRFTVLQTDADVADTSSETVILEIPQPQTNHNGGQIAFGADGNLYIAVGDGGGGGDPDGNAQNRSNLLGNILRIDVDNSENSLNYSIPEDNPYVNETAFRNEIYAYGLRNPWRMSFDTQTDKLWAGDVGQNKIEEIDVIELGGNYGWNLFEGTDCFSGNCDGANLINPIFEYTQDNGDRSITGGYVYRGAENTSIQGKYIYSDFVSGRIWALAEDGSSNELLLASGLNVSSFGTDANEELYVLAFSGSIYKLIEN